MAFLCKYERDFYYKCSRCGRGWYNRHTMPAFRIPGMFSFAMKCKGCGKSVEPFREADAYES
jgi:DNA-directed RNA polymerase subunit RPC12/RpoP